MYSDYVRGIVVGGDFSGLLLPSLCLADLSGSLIAT